MTISIENLREIANRMTKGTGLLFSSEDLLKIADTIDSLRSELEQVNESADAGMWSDKIMKQWDYWRKEIAAGDTSSGPRDWFESLSQADALTKELK